MTVLADSGIRTGLDVVRMLASGAMFEIMAKEMRVAMTLNGAARIADLNRSNLSSPSLQEFLPRPL